MEVIRILAIAVLLISVAGSSFPVNFCFNKTTEAIPKNHLFWKKEKPLIIGHRGQPRVYQENTVESVTSLLEVHADGFEIDIYLTKDKELVVFHDDNTKTLTGKDAFIWDLTLPEIRKLRLEKVLNYKNNKYTYKDALAIPTLEEVLLAVKDSDLFMYLEMKPSHNPRYDSRDTQRSIDTGRAVAKLVTKLGLESKSFLVSFDPVKPWAAKQQNSALVVGTFFEIADWEKSPADFVKLKDQYMKQLPHLECLKSMPANSDLTDFLHESGSIFKAINASFVDMQYAIYNNPKYSNDTIAKLRANYRHDISTGGWTFFSMKMNAKEMDESETTIQVLVKQGIERLITDDVPRMRRLLQRTSSSVRTVPEAVTLTFLLFSASIARYLLR